MPNPDQIRGNLLEVQNRVEKDLSKLAGMYESFSKEIHRRLLNEYQESGTMQGLEDFHRFDMLLKHNKIIALNMRTAISRLKNIEDFDISEKDIEDRNKTSK